MVEQITVTCIKTTNYENLVLVEYRDKGQSKIMGVPCSCPDYELAKQLKPGTKFTIEMRDTEIKPTPNFQIKPTIEPLPYITGIVTSQR